jgi:threonylcarbamoyladenosine tRNA methylthiotransferase MtaB
MATFSIENFGCRATDADAASIRGGLVKNGLQMVESHAAADFVVLNTCTVTGAADSQAREAIRKIHRANPAARILVTGCYAQRVPEELAALPGVTWVVGNSHQGEIPGLVCEPGVAFPVGHRGDNILEPVGAGKISRSADFVSVSEICGESDSRARAPARILSGDIFELMELQTAPATLIAGDRTRPILKVQDGCNNRCAYCVIPFVRGRSRSLAPDAVIGEVRALVAAGAREIVLSGINLGSYGRDLAPRATLAGVVRRILAETDVEQLRFSSIEPQDVTADFVGMVAESPRLAPHFHVPLQSGSDRILGAMHRWYRAAHYAERIETIRRMLPDAAIGADVIAGFPGETDEDFQATLDLIERLPFSYVHVFSFSARPGTQQAEPAAAVPAQVLRERARALRALGEAKNAAFRTAQVGRKLRALTLHRQGENWTEALTGNYLKVRVAGLHAANEWRELRLCADALHVHDSRDACKAPPRSVTKPPGAACGESAALRG